MQNIISVSLMSSFFCPDKRFLFCIFFLCLFVCCCFFFGIPEYMVIMSYCIRFYTVVVIVSHICIVHLH